ncbi:MAG: 2Fe-2S iron-sulfur cluster binding domain-containing protein [Desulfobacterales bacterium]
MKVEFKKSGKTATWDDSYENILELAEENGIEIETECEAGVCGTCKTKMLSGDVHMEVDDGLDDDDRAENYILPCVAVPKTDVVLDV